MRRLLQANLEVSQRNLVKKVGITARDIKTYGAWMHARPDWEMHRGLTALKTQQFRSLMGRSSEVTL